MGISILVYEYCTVNTAKLRIAQSKEKGAAEMAVTAAQTRQALAERGVSRRGTSGLPAGEQIRTKKPPQLLIRPVLQSRLHVPY